MIRMLFAHSINLLSILLLGVSLAAGYEPNCEYLWIKELDSTSFDECKGNCTTTDSSENKCHRFDFIQGPGSPSCHLFFSENPLNDSDMSYYYTLDGTNRRLMPPMFLPDKVCFFENQIQEVSHDSGLKCAHLNVTETDDFVHNDCASDCEETTSSCQGYRFNAATGLCVRYNNAAESNNQSQSCWISESANASPSQLPSKSGNPTIAPSVVPILLTLESENPSITPTSKTTAQPSYSPSRRPKIKKTCPFKDELEQMTKDNPSVELEADSNELHLRFTNGASFRIIPTGNQNHYKYQIGDGKKTKTSKKKYNRCKKLIRKMLI